MLKMELGEQAELLYRVLTEQDFKIKDKEDKRESIVNTKRDRQSCKYHKADKGN